MRYVDRTKVEPPASLTDPDCAGLRELQRAQEHYRDHHIAPKPAAFGFKAYKSGDVIDALARLFHKKCAYCESSYAAVQPMDVEHYRPKGGVHDAPGHPGYWWLAAEWTNLLPSCIDCNRRRYQDLYRIEAEGRDAAALQQLAGKQNMFPIAAGRRRAGGAADVLADEDALLIDPCQRDPAAHLAWARRDPGTPDLTSVLLPALAVPKMAGAAEDPYARASIDVYGLNRSGLVDARKDLIVQLEYELEALERAIRNAAYLPPEVLATELPGIIKQADYLGGHGMPTRPYSACATAFIQSSLTQLLDSLEHLRQQSHAAPPGNQDHR